MKTVGIIPARYNSSRFPGKPLALIHGISMIERVYNRAVKSELLNEVIVATDDQRIFDHVVSFGGKVVMTSSEHLSGTDRCAEAVIKTNVDFDVVVNVQGDEPYIDPGQIDLLINCFYNPDVSIATLVRQITNEADLDNVNLPKVVMSEKGNALYFSRNEIPFCHKEKRNVFIDEKRFFRHIGIYGYRVNVLHKIAALSPGKLEQVESLEQLRWLENGYQIMTAQSNHENLAVDTPEDIQIIESHFPASD